MLPLLMYHVAWNPWVLSVDIHWYVSPLPSSNWMVITVSGVAAWAIAGAEYVTPSARIAAPAVRSRRSEGREARVVVPVIAVTPSWHGVAGNGAGRFRTFVRNSS